MPPDLITLTVNGKPVTVTAGASVAAAILIAGEAAFRHSVSGQPRGPLCGMGICYECRVTIDRIAQCRSCQIPCRSGMQVVTT
jgi:D-hydroxyproline dehydrogenase subunit gamma